MKLPVREALGLSIESFAQLLGVNRATVYRREAVPGAVERVVPFQAVLLAVLDELVRRGHGAEFGEQITPVIQVGGSLRGLHLVLQTFYGAGRGPVA